MKNIVVNKPLTIEETSDDWQKTRQQLARLSIKDLQSLYQSTKKALTQARLNQEMDRVFVYTRATKAIQWQADQLGFILDRTGSIQPKP